MGIGRITGSAGGQITPAARVRKRSSGEKYKGADVGKVVDGVVAMIITTATEGLASAGTYTEQRAKHYAPVRRVFADTRGVANGGKVVKTVNRFTVGGSALQGASSGVAGNRGVFIRTPEQMRQFKKSRLHGRRVAPEEDVYGRPNDYKPVLRTADGELRGGDFRRVRMGPDGPVLAKVGFTSSEGVGTGRGSGTFALTARGRYELKRGRAFFGAKDENDSFHQVKRPEGWSGDHEDRRGIRVVETRLGGRLRNEIYTTPPVRRGQWIWVWVVSPTPYARYQEFGTRHNRAHPFLRPALYEARRFLPNAIRSAFRHGRRVSPRFKTGVLSVRR